MKLYLRDITGFEKHNATYSRTGFISTPFILFTINGKEYKRKVRTRLALFPTYEQTTSFKGLSYFIR